MPVSLDCDEFLRYTGGRDRVIIQFSMRVLKERSLRSVCFCITGNKVFKLGQKPKSFGLRFPLQQESPSSL